MSRIDDSATSAITSPALGAGETRSPLVRAADRSGSADDRRDQCTAGATPLARPASNALRNANPTTRASMRTRPSVRAGARRLSHGHRDEHGRERDARNTSSKREQQMLGQKLRRDPCPAGPKRGPDRNFRSAAHRRAKLQAGDVGRGDRQEHQNQRKHDRERPIDVTREPLLKRIDANSASGIRFWIFTLELGGNPVELNCDA